MAGTTIRMTASKQLTLEKIHETLHRIKRVESISKTVQEIGGVQIWVLAYERYYFRIGGYASATIVLTEREDTQSACIVASGGGEGAVNYSWGANRNFAKDCVEVMLRCGFTPVESDPDTRGKPFSERFSK